MTIKDAKEVNLNGWTLSGGGSQGDSYTRNDGSETILKLFAKDYDPANIISELEITRAVVDAGVSCPGCGDFIRVGDRYGIIFKRIMNKKSFCRAMGDNPSCTPDMARRLAGMALDLHSRPSEGTIFPSALDWYKGLALNDKLIGSKMREIILDAVEEVRPYDRKTLIHGDFHFGNVITDGRKDYFIDLGTFAYGNPDFDNSNLYFSCKLIIEEGLKHNYHIGRKEALEFWDVYKAAYYGPDAPPDDELFERFRPYLLIRTLFFDLSNIPVQLTGGLREMLLTKKSE